MAYHEAFWAACASAAPVIAFAQLFALGRLFIGADREVGENGRSGRMIVATVGSMAATGSIMLSAIAFGGALNALREGKNPIKGPNAIQEQALMITSFGLVAAVACAAGALEVWERRSRRNL